MTKFFKFVGKKGEMPSGGTTGYWEIGKIYKADDHSSPLDTGHICVIDETGRKNGWCRAFFEEVPSSYPDKPNKKVADYYLDLFSYLHFRAKDHPGDMYGGVKVEDALKAACNLTNIEYDLIVRILEGSSE